MPNVFWKAKEQKDHNICEIANETHISSVVVGETVVTCSQLTFQQILKQNSL